jgi:ADP-heptose:LPS heptosyltransferase
LRKILVFRIGHLGDTLVSLPAFWRIRDTFPDASISLLTNFDLHNPTLITPKDVLPKTGLFDDWIEYPSRGSGSAQRSKIIKLLLNLRKRRYDAVFYLPPRSRTKGQAARDTWFFRAAGIRRVFGKRSLEKHRLPLQSPPDAPAVISEAEYLIDCVSDAISGERSTHYKNDLLINDEERMAASSWLGSVIRPEKDRHRLIAVAPGSKWASKIWDEGRYRDVVSQLVKQWGVTPVVFGGKEDREKGERLVAKWGSAANSCGELTVRQSAALLERCSLYLGNDTGTMHLAAAVGTKCVAVFAAIDLEGRWTPMGEGHQIFRTRVECQHCHTPSCFNFNKCLDLIEVNAVLEACNEVLSREYLDKS